MDSLSSERTRKKSKKDRSSKRSSASSLDSSSKSRSRRSRARAPVSSRVTVTAPNAASPGRAVAVVCTSAWLVLAMILSLPRGTGSRGVARINLVRWLQAGATRLRHDPMHSLKLLFWLVMISGVIAVSVSMADDLGGDRNGKGGGGVIPSSLFGFLRGSGNSGLGASAMALVPDADADEDDVPAAVGGAPKKRVSKAVEVEFACKEVGCIERCTGKKLTKKCLASEGCLRVRLATCKKKCRKNRCENRCKLEAAVGYVEREMKLDKCKEDCGSDSKCNDRCDKDFQTCKSRCAERKKKFACDREAVINFPKPANKRADDPAAKDHDAQEDEEEEAEEEEGDDEEDAGQDAGDDDNI